jgi:hypothetical protein
MHPINIGRIFAKLIAAILLLIAVGWRHPYDYYTLLRWIACSVSAFTAYQAIESKRKGWGWIFTIAAIMVNPIIPLHLKRPDWAVVDITIAVLLLVSTVVLDFKK